MKVLLINTSERTGGAAIAAGRLLEALNNHGVEAKLLVRDKQTGRVSVVRTGRRWLNKWNFLWERFVIWVNNRFDRSAVFAVDIANTGMDITPLPEFRQADVIHLHWTNQGMLSLKGIEKILKSGKPVVWTMHDMWPFTGICHYSGSCARYQQWCHYCPFLNGGGKKDLSTRTFLRKHRLYRTAPITFVTCSRWLGEVAKESALLAGHTVTSIPNPINTHLFCPGDKRKAREKLNLPPDMSLLLFGSAKITDERKGLTYLIEACKILAERYPEMKEQCGVVVFGRHSRQLESLIPFRVYPLEFISSEHGLAEMYSAADLYLTPSLEDNLPNTIMEALACGLPCVGFRTGGIPEMIDHRRNGYVARYRSAEDFAEGIRWALTEAEYETLSEEAVRKVKKSYSESAVAQQYIEIYNYLTHKHA